MSRRLILAAPPMALTLALAACGPAGKSAASKTSAPAAAPAPVMVTRHAADGAIDRFTPYASGPLALDEFSVGPLMAQTEFSLDAVRQRFPKAKVADGTPITVEQGGVFLEILDNPGTRTVGDIRVTGSAATGPRGETLGLKWADADMDYPRCWAGQDRDAHAVVCTQPGEPVLRYVFAVPGWTEQTMPPVAVLRDKGVLRNFIWRGGAPTQ